MKPMKPEDFAKILCEKLEKVIQQRALAEGNAPEKSEQVPVRFFEPIPKCFVDLDEDDNNCYDKNDSND